MNHEEYRPEVEADKEALKVIRGQEVLEQTAADPETFYYFCPRRLGDTVIALGFARAAARRCGFRRVTAVVKSGHRLFAEFYAHLFDAVCISHEDMNAFEKFCMVYQIYQGENWLYAYTRYIPANVNGKQGFKLDLPGVISTVSYYDRFRWTFSLPARVRNDPMRIQPPDGMREELTKKYSLSRTKTIVLMPYAYSFMLAVDTSFWTALAQYLTEAGYTVYSNVGYESEEPVPGTLPMHTTFEELYCVSQSVRAFVSMRSGITDFLASIAAPQIVLTSAARLSMMRDYVSTAEELRIPCRTIQLSLQNASFFWLICVINTILCRPIQEYLLPEPED